MDRPLVQDFAARRLSSSRPHRRQVRTHARAQLLVQRTLNGRLYVNTACACACSFFLVITGEQNKKKITYIPVAEEDEEGNHAPTEIEMGESQLSVGHRQKGASHVA
jgi:hypothetical protein